MASRSSRRPAPHARRFAAYAFYRFYPVTSPGRARD
jgi:hypothetical protein